MPNRFATPLCPATGQPCPHPKICGLQTRFGRLIRLWVASFGRGCGFNRQRITRHDHA